MLWGEGVFRLEIQVIKFGVKPKFTPIKNLRLSRIYNASFKAQWGYILGHTGDIKWLQGVTGCVSVVILSAEG